MGMEEYTPHVDTRLWEPRMVALPQVAYLLRDLQYLNNWKTVENLERSAQKYASPYLAWEVVRKHFAGEVVGEVVETRTHSRLPWTGMEGYFVGQDLTAEAIIRKTAAIGLEIDQELYTKLNIKAGMKANTIQNALMGAPIERAAEVWREIYKAYLKAINQLRELPKDDEARREFTEFRGRTYALIAGHPPIDYNWSIEGVSRTIHLPRNLPPINPDRIRHDATGVTRKDSQVPHGLTMVTLDNEQLLGYLLSAEIGKARDPLILTLMEREPHQIYGELKTEALA